MNILALSSRASYDRLSGTTASFIFRGDLAVGSRVLEDLFAHVTESKGSLPAIVNFLVIFIKKAFRHHGVTVSVPKPHYLCKI